MVRGSGWCWGQCGGRRWEWDLLFLFRLEADFYTEAGGGQTIRFLFSETHCDCHSLPLGNMWQFSHRLWGRT
ncbi:hypothetical protein XELAEV_18036475mg [Xenopus laevis]|uniref:Uncharacterized protein n=1 Tax=Xenopus laevis TaxID=8355 RepID=A0A974CHZ2_XENLA|nr:hypothetical protein XELAEV_18036475mg [Xenopus laevis]